MPIGLLLGRIRFRYPPPILPPFHPQGVCVVKGTSWPLFALPTTSLVGHHHDWTNQVTSNNAVSRKQFSYENIQYVWASRPYFGHPLGVRPDVARLLCAQLCAVSLRQRFCRALHLRACKKRKG